MITGLAVLAGALALSSQAVALRRIPMPPQPQVATREDGNAAANDAAPLEVVQAATPPRESLDGCSCRQTLLEHSFTNSYGAPYVGVYTAPPPDCAFTTTVLNLSVASQGQQYDRLAQLFIGDVEVWRTSTAMPIDRGIHWSFHKDVSAFDALMRSANHKLILDLGNVVDGDLYTGVYNVTLEALYYDDTFGRADSHAGGFHPAELIYPISNVSASAYNSSPVFSLPDDAAAATLSLPRNIRTAVVSLLASGNGDEEFWFTNVPTEYVETFPANAGWLYGHGPFREVQLLLDGHLAGVSWPFPILFTGGVDPGLWRPVAGIDAFDLSSFEIDVTPWLSLLCDGGEHTFAIDVVGSDGGSVGQNWWVTGAVFVWLDHAVNQTVAGAVTSDVPAPEFDFVSVVGTSAAANGSVANESLWFSLSALRTLSVSSAIGNVTVSWTQDLSFTNVQNMTNLAYNQSLAMNSTGSHAGSSFPSYGDGASHYSYPLNLYSYYHIADDDDEKAERLSSVFCMIDRSRRENGVAALPYLTGSLTGPGSLETRQNATSSYYWNETIVGGIEELSTCSGNTWYSYSGEPASGAGIAAYSRYLREEDDAMVADRQAWATMAVPETEPLPAVEGEPNVYSC